MVISFLSVMQVQAVKVRTRYIRKPFQFSAILVSYVSGTQSGFSLRFLNSINIALVTYLHDGLIISDHTGIAIRKEIRRF